jgi:endoglucanase
MIFARLTSIFSLLAGAVCLMLVQSGTPAQAQQNIYTDQHTGARSLAAVKYVDAVQLTDPVQAAPQKPVIVRHVVRPLYFTGVNLAGGEFGDRKPGIVPTYGTQYIFPSESELDYFAGKGANIIRFPFRWVDLQPVLNQPLDTVVLNRIKDVVKAANAHGQIVLLDPHDSARFYGKVVGSPEVPNAAFADFWGRLASQFPKNSRVWLGLANEPHDMPGAQWLSAANAAIASIRKVGAKNLILVPGIAYSGAHSWISSGNSEAMLGVIDPQNHYIFEVHQYLDPDSSGTRPEAVSATIGSERLKAFTLWCRQHHQRGFLGEFAAANNPTSLLAADDMMTYMEQNQDVWVGFTWWAAGAWWGDYMFTVEPKNGQDRPQMATLEPHFQKAPAPRTKVINSMF